MSRHAPAPSASIESTISVLYATVSGWCQSAQWTTDKHHSATLTRLPDGCLEFTQSGGLSLRVHGHAIESPFRDNEESVCRYVGVSRGRERRETSHTHSQAGRVAALGDIKLLKISHFFSTIGFARFASDGVAAESVSAERCTERVGGRAMLKQNCKSSFLS
jgi:hypothetical protein